MKDEMEGAVMSQTVYRELFTCIAPSRVDTPAPADELERFLAASTFYCELYVARIRQNHSSPA